MTNVTKKNSPLKMVLGERNFFLLWIGETISLIGDQFYLIALPWLVLQLTGDAVSVGGVLAVASIPRALFMLIGGVMTDRFSPRKVMLASNLLRMMIVLVLTFLVFTTYIELWMLYVVALVFGVVDAFFFPAQSAIVPQMVSKEHLQIGNSIIQGTAQLSRFGGPILAGALITILSTANGDIPGLDGIAYAFGFDAFTFLVSAITLFMITMPVEQTSKDGTPAKEHVLSAIKAGLENVWNDVPLRNIFFITIGINVLVNGPILVGIPVLADARFAEGATAFGLIMSSYGGGNLLGTILAGVLPRPSAKIFSTMLLVTITALGLGVAFLGVVTSMAMAVIIGLLMGIANGYVTILFITWLQNRTPQAMLGRVMSLLMFSSIGLNPISMALSGFFLDISITWTFLAAGSLMAFVVLAAALNPAVRSISLEMENGQ